MFKKVKYSVAIISMLLMQVGLTAQKADLKQLGEQIMHFYENPQQQVFNDIQRELLKMTTKNEHLPPMVVWADKISQKYGWAVNDDFYPTVMQQLHNPQSTLSQFIADDNSINAEKLDIWWSSFFATGEANYVRNVFNQAIKLEEVKRKKQKTEQDMLYFVTLGSAVWSFKSNCQQHEKIRTFAQDWLQEKDLTPEGKELLTICINGDKNE